MVPFDTWLLFAVAIVALAMTPGPDLVCLVSRSLVQGRVAGLVSPVARLVFDTRR